MLKKAAFTLKLPVFGIKTAVFSVIIYVLIF